MVRGGSSQRTTAEWIELDKLYITPSFTVRQFQSHELLSGTRNFKDWDGMITLELRAANLSPFIESKCGMSIEMSPARRVMCDAQVVQYLRASVSQSIGKRINTILNAYDTYKELKKLFADNDFAEYMELHNRMQYLKYRPGFDVDRYIADFDRLVDDYKTIGTEYSEAYKKSLFLNKIDSVRDPRSPFFSFYSTVVSLPPEIATLDYIKQHFQNIAKNIPAINKTSTSVPSGTKRKPFEQQSETPAKKPKQDQQKQNQVKSKPLSEKYTTKQREQLKNMSAEERKKLQCTKCSDYFHKADECPHPGRLCFNCFFYGHEKTECNEKPRKLNISHENFNHNLCIYVDTCSNSHITGDRNHLLNFESYDNPINVNSIGGTVSAVGEGILPILVTHGKNKTILYLSGVQLVPESKDTIISVSKFNVKFKSSLIANPKSGYLLYRKFNRKIASITEVNGMYCMNVKTINCNHVNISDMSHPNQQYDDDGLFVMVTVSDTNPNDSDRIPKIKPKRKRKGQKLSFSQRTLLEQEGELWHRRMGHISPPIVNKLKNVTIGVNDLITPMSLSSCEVCSAAKLHKKSFNKDRDRATRPCQIVHVDLMGPITPVTFEKHNSYIMCVIDDYTRFLQAFVIKSKSASDVTPCLNEALRFLQACFPGPGQFDILRCDNGTEFCNEHIDLVLEKYGIVRESSEPYCHEHNGLVERLNRTIQERARALLFEAGFPANKWGLAIHAACYIYNRTPHSSIEFVTPFEMLYGKPPDVSTLKVFGSCAYALDEQVPKGKKFQPRSKKLYVVGYTKTGYTLFDPTTEKTIDLCNVKIDEKKLYKTDFPSNKNETFELQDEHLSPDDPLPSSSNQTTPQLPPHSNFTSPLPEIEPESDLESEKEYEEIELDCDWDNSPIQVKQCYIESFSSIKSFENPMTYTLATAPENIREWGQPIESELKMMYDRETWSLVPREKSMVVVPTKWDFTTKTDGKKKARIVAVGCRDPEKYTSKDTSSPTPKTCSVRWLFAAIVIYQWSSVQYDVKNAFLYADLDRVKYITLPQGAKGDRKKYVGKVNRALYGFPTAPKCWNELLNAFLLSLGFTRSERDPCVYIHLSNGKIVIIIVHIDDMVITGDDVARIEYTCNCIKNRFEIKDLGKPQRFLGFQLEWNNDNKELLLHQTQYVNEVLDMFGFKSGTLALTPMVPICDHRHIKTNKNDDNFCSYKQAIGALQYLSTLTRPDITFAVNFLARAQTNPQSLHWNLLKQIFLYLNGTRTTGLRYLHSNSSNSSDMLDAYVDSDYAGDPRTRKSTSGFIIRFHNNVIHWGSRLQSACAESSGEAEFVAICDASKEILFLARLIEETLGTMTYPITVYEDNSAAISISYDTTSNSRIKHVELKYLKKREYIRKKILKIVKINSKWQLADCLTKALPKELFCSFRDKIVTHQLKTKPIRS